MMLYKKAYVFSIVSLLFVSASFKERKGSGLAYPADLVAPWVDSANSGTSGQPFYEITRPLFPKITLHLNPRYYPGGTFTISSEGKGRYIQSAKLNRDVLEQPRVLHETVVKGGNLTLQMGENPNKCWGARPQDAPPSMSN